MSMTDEGRGPASNMSASTDQESEAPRPNGAGQPGGALPGLAAFGQMQGYAPVTGGAEAPAEPEPVYEAPPEAPAEQADPNQGTYEQDHPEPPHIYATNEADTQVAADAAEAGDLSAAFDEEALRRYMEENNLEAGTVGQGYEEPAFPQDSFQGDEAGYQHHGSMELETFEAHYDDHPEIPLNAFEQPGTDQPQPQQPMYDTPASDADFMVGETAEDVAEPKERKGRKILMAASGLIGVLALGGALAFAYKIGGDSNIASTGQPPLIQADKRPVKVAPDKPGGKQFPHKNKKIYERLQGADGKAEPEKLVSRQEDVAAAATAALNKSSGATTVKAPAPAATPPGVPRKVKTLTVRPDGSMVPSSSGQKVVKAPVSPPGTVTASDGTVAMTFPQPSGAAPKAAQSAQQPLVPSIPKPAVVTPPPAQPRVAAAPAVAAPPPVPKPAVPKPAPAPQRTASAPAAAPASSSGSYVVQVAARKSQADALATFADIQQKYPRLLSGYGPLIKKADLGSKGIWYRLNIGPVESKSVASSLCSQLKSAGMRSCIIRAN